MLLCCTQSTEQSPGKTSRGKGLPLTVVSSNLDAVRGWEEAVPALPAAHAGQLQRHLAQRHVVVEGVLQQRGNVELGQAIVPFFIGNFSHTLESWPPRPFYSLKVCRLVIYTF